MECKFCNKNKAKKNGKTKAGNLNFVCQSCKKSWTVKTVKARKKRKIEKDITMEGLEKEILIGCIQNASTSPKWAQITLKILQCLDPKYAKNATQNFTPEDYGKHLKEVLKNLDE